MLKVGAFVQLACVAAAPLVLWLSAPTAYIRGVDLEGRDAIRFAAPLASRGAQVVQISPDGETVVARGRPGVMAFTLLRAGALPLPLAGPGGACASSAGAQT
jgi:hypothetical protein